MELLELIKNKDYTAIFEALPEKKVEQAYYEEYLGDRKIRDNQVGYRVDRFTKSGKKVTRSRIAINFQKKITRTACSFLFSNPPKKQSLPESIDALTEFNQSWKDARINNILMPFAEAVKSETEAAIAFFSVVREGEETKIKARLLSRANGNIYPVFDAYGDMKAFIWTYDDKEDDSVSYIHTWTAEKYISIKKQGNSFEEVKNDVNEFGKIPIVYASQEFPEWWDVLDLIDSYENSHSKFVDTNGYFASPMYKAKGYVGKMPQQDEDGRMVKMDVVETDKGNVITADLDVLSWDRSPESLKMEFEQTYDLIHYISDTPDLSFNNLTGLGNVAENTMRLMFMSPIMKAKWSEPKFYTALERIASILKSGMVNITQKLTASEEEQLPIYFTFQSSLPQNIKDTIQSLVEATAGEAVMSQRTALEMNPMVMDPESEKEQIQEEALERSRADLGMEN